MKQAMILCGGKGTRLRPYTLVLPKPLMPIGDFPILEVVVKQLVYFGFDKITLAVNHQAALFKAFFGNGEKWNVTIDYLEEEKELGTMGALSLLESVPDNLLVMNGDVLSDLNFKEFYNVHQSSKASFSISSYNREQKVDFGVLECDNPERRLSGFREKPVYSFEVSMGIYMLNKALIDLIPKNEFFGFDDLMKVGLNKGYDIRLIRHDGFWLDIGRPDDYIEAIDIFKEKESYFIRS